MPTKDEINATISSNDVVMYSKTYCPYCKMAKSALDSLDIKYELIEIENLSDMDQTQDILKEMTGARSVPRVFVKGKCIGGGTETKNMAKSGELKKLLA